MKKRHLPNVPFVQAKNQGTTFLFRHRPKRIVIRNVDVTSDPGAALGIAYNWHYSDSKEPSHYVVDSGTSFRCVEDRYTCGTTRKGRRGAIYVTLCAPYHELESSWIDSTDFAAIRNLSSLTADICRAHHIPPRRIKFEIVGSFPQGMFIDLVKAKLKERK